MKRHKLSPFASRRKSKLRGRLKPQRSSRRMLSHVEQLEDRRVLEANPLAAFEGTIDPADSTDVVELSVLGGDTSNIVALRASGTSGNFNPGELQIENGSSITPIVSLSDIGNSNDSFLLVDLPSGSFDVTIRGESGTGDFQLQAYLLGDLDDGLVSQIEMATANAANFQQDGLGNHVAQLFYRQFGVNLGEDQYDEAFDANMDGSVDSFDLEWLNHNVDGPMVTMELVGDENAPVLAAELRNDTGINDIPDSLSDGLTNDVSGDIIIGTLSDESQILSFMAAIDPSDPTDIGQYVDVSGNLEDDPNSTPSNNGTEDLFGFTLDELESIFGSTVLNNGEHTLYLIATDSMDNAIDPSMATMVTFSLDTVAPDAPTNLVLESDSGDSSTDGITNVTTPTIGLSSEEGALVEISSTPTGVTGSGIVAADGTVSIVSAELSDDTYDITATATDLAGNVSSASGPLQVTIDTQIVEVSMNLTAEFDLTDGDTIGDNQTPDGVVDFEGVTEPGASVSLFRIVPGGDDDLVGSTTADATTGAYSFADVTLLNTASEREVEFRVVAKDVAGNELEQVEKFTRNTRPAIVGSSPDDITLDEDEELTRVIDLASFINDADFSNGGDTLNLVANSSNPSVAEVSLSNEAGDATQYDFDTLTLTFPADAFGESTITVTVTDEFDLSFDFSFNVTLNAVNDVPLFDLGVDLDIDEDAGEETVSGFATNISAGAANESGQTLEFLVSVDPGSPNLFDGDVEIDADGNLTFTPLADANGTATILVQLMDDGGTGNGGVNLSAVKSFDITINSLNDAPTFTLAGDMEVDEDSGENTHTDIATNISPGPDDEAGQDVTFSVTTDNDGAFTAGGLPVIDANGDMTYTLADDAFGSVLITVTLTDDGLNGDGNVNFSEQTFTLDIKGLNDAPVALDDGVDAVATGSVTLDVLTNDNSGVDAGDPNEELRIDPATLTQPTNGLGTVEVSADGKSILFTAADGVTAGETGMFTYTILDRADDSGLSSEVATVTITIVENSVIAVDDDFTVGEHTAGVELDVVANDSDPQGDSFTIISISAGDQGGTFEFNINDQEILYTPVPDFSGVETFTYTIRDDGDPAAESTATATITVTNVNDAPVFTLPANPDQELFEGTTAEQTISGFASDISAGGLGDSESDQVLTFNISTDNDDLFSEGPAIDPITGDLTYTLAGEDANGSATVTVELMDDGGTVLEGEEDTSASQTFVINVTPINDAPTFNMGGDQTNGQSSGEQTVVDFATNITRGGGLDETIQTLTFDIVTDNDALFSVLPAIDPSTGDLTFTPAANAQGTATVSVTLMDNGGTENGGIDTSATQTFDIVINDVNDAPEIVSAIGDFTRNDFDSPAPEVFDLSNVFSDPDGDTLSFAVTSSNEEIVTAEIINGDELRLTYATYTALQDRTPSVITVTATDDGPGTLETDEVFTVTLTPENTVDVQLVILSEATALDNDGGLSRTTLPTSLSQIPVGETFVVEVWVKDLLADGTIAGVASQEFTGGAFDLNFDQLLGEGTELTNANHAGDFSAITLGMVNNTDGLVEGFGGGSLDSPGLAVEPNFARLGFVQFTATSAGSQSFTLDLDSSGRTENLTDNPARVSIDGNSPSPASGSINPAQVNFGSVTIDQVETMAFSVDSGQSEVTASGTLGGEAFFAQDAGVSDTPQASGTLDVSVDNLSNPTMLQIFGSELTWENTGDWTPDVNGGGFNNPGSAPAILGFEDPEFNVFGSPITMFMAMRNLNSTVFTDGSVSLDGSGEFSADDWTGLINSADVDGSLNGSPMSQAITDVTMVNNGAAAASLTSVGNTMTLTIPLNHTLTGTTFNDLELVLNLSGQLVATFTDSGSAAASASGEPSNEAAILAAFDEALSDWDDSIL